MNGLALLTRQHQYERTWSSMQAAHEKPRSVATPGTRFPVVPRPLTRETGRKLIMVSIELGKKFATSGRPGGVGCVAGSTDLTAGRQILENC